MSSNFKDTLQKKIDHHKAEVVRLQSWMDGLIADDFDWDNVTEVQAEIIFTYKCGYQQPPPMEGHSEQGGTNMNDDVLAHLREARACLLDERDSGANSRELSITLTEIDTAILWRQQDLQLKAAPINEQK